MVSRLLRSALKSHPSVAEMPSCVFRRCTNYTGTVKDKKKVSFHALPRDEFIKEKWVNIIRTQRREDDWLPTKYSTICSQHFLESDIYVTQKNCRKLKNTAVPVIKQGEPDKTSSRTSLEQVDESNENSTFDTSGKAFLMSRIRKISQAKRILQVRNNYLARRNKRLKEKCNNLKQIVSDLLLRVRTKPRMETIATSENNIF